MKNYEKVNGIVVCSRLFKEKDKLVTLITEKGTVEAVAKGAYSFKSHWIGRFEPLTELNLTLFHGPKITTITQAYISNAHLSLRDKLEPLTYGLAMVNLVLDLSVVNSNDYKLYQLLTAALNELEKNPESELIFAALILKALKAVGIFPYLNSCVKCKKTGGELFFNVSAGGLICSFCLPEQPQKYLIKKATLKLILNLLQSKFSDLKKVKKDKTEVKFITELIWEHLLYHLPTNARVQLFLKNVNKN